MKFLELVDIFWVLNILFFHNQALNLHKFSQSQERLRILYELSIRPAGQLTFLSDFRSISLDVFVFLIIPDPREFIYSRTMDSWIRLV